jgi:ankyrin repeat protein
MGELRLASQPSAPKFRPDQGVASLVTAMANQDSRLTAEDVLRRYREEDLPAFCGSALENVNQRGLFGEYPLDVAATRAALDEVLALLDGGAEIDAHGEHGNTALHEAVDQGHAEVVRVLLDRGASPTEKNDDGMLPIEIAKMYNRSDLIGLLQRE